MALDLNALSSKEAVTAIFIGYYDRAPAPTGLNYWAGEIDAGRATLAQTATAFAVVAESQANYPALSVTGSTDLAGNVAFVTAVFQNLFGRDPSNIDTNGGADNFWVAQLEGGADIGQLILDIMSGAQGNDLQILENKIEVGVAYAAAAEADGTLTRDPAGDTILDGVTETPASVALALAAVEAQFPTPVVVVPGSDILLQENVSELLDGTDGNDTFWAEDGALNSGDRLDGGAGKDTLMIFNESDGIATSPRTTSVEQVVMTNQMNDLNSVADNNVGGYSTVVGGELAGNLPLDGTIEVDVEIDGGRMNGVSRWEDFDSRADVVIEDARDMDDTDGTFTGDITVAMVSTDPGNVDFAVYFDQPVNTSQNFGTLELRVLDQEAAFGLPAPAAGSEGYLTESSLISFIFNYDGQDITVTLPDEEGVSYGADVSFSDLLAQVELATQNALAAAGVTDLGFTATLGAPVTVGVGNQFTLPMILTFDVTADSIVAQNDNIVVLGRDSSGNDATDTFGALSTDRTTTEELIRLNVELDDVGKGSMGGDAMFGAMSTGRQGIDDDNFDGSFGDDGTSDSIGIQQFDIEVDRSSQLQTINSTNNSLEVVNITNGENDGPNNTTTAADEMIGDLTVRGQANPPTDFVGPLGGVATDGPMPGAVAQHNSFGFSDVRVIDGSSMTGRLDITAELTEEIVEKYLNIEDSGADGEADDVTFNYALGNNNDEFLLEMSSDALNSAGTGSREDFDLTISGGAGNDVITTNIGTSDRDTTQVGSNTTGAIKRIDEQGQDHYELTSSNNEFWYQNAVSNVATEMSVNGGAGADTIWTHGWGDFTIDGGAGADVVYTDNSAAQEGENTVAGNIDRNLTEHDQIDYVAGAVWAFNAENVVFANPGSMSGITNDVIAIGTVGVLPVTATTGNAVFSISFGGAAGVAGTEYVVSTTVPFSELTVNSTTGVVTMDEQALNQAIKAGINNDPILSNLLEAADGPGNSLVVVAKSDGAHVATDLAIALTSVTVNGTAATPTPLTNTAYTTPEFIDIGGSSFTESDNTIMSGGDAANDLFVLSTTDAGAPSTAGGLPDGGPLALSDLNGASNEVVKFAAGFGRDTIVNFDFGDASGFVDAAEDVLDFSMITGTANTYVSTGATYELTSGDADGTIDFIDLATVPVDGADAGSSIEAAEVVALFGAGDAVASDHILIIRDATNLSSSVASDNNAGQVWHIVDGAAATGDVSATQIGTINLIGTDWLALTADNFA